MVDHRYAARRDLWLPLAVAGGYYLGAKLGFALTLQPTPVSVLWPPNALLLAGLLLAAPRLWPRILAATLVVHLVGQIEAAVPLRMALCWFVSNCTEALIGAALLRRLGGPHPTFDRFRYAMVFVVCAAVVAPFLSSFLDAAFVSWNGWGQSPYSIVWRTRFFSNMLSTLTLVPVVVIVATQLEQLRRVPPARWIEAGLGLAVLLATSWAAFDAQRVDIRTSPVLTYAVMPLRLIAALRFGPIGAGLSSLVCALTAISGAVAGRGPFVGSSPLDNALSIQLFLIVTHVSLMLLAAVMTERTRAEEAAQINERQLEMALSAARLIPWEWHVKPDLATGSPALWEMLGMPEPVAESSRRFIEGVHPDDRPLVRAALAEAMEGRPFDIEFRVVHRDGSVHWLLSRGTTRFDVAGAADTIIGVLVDITARKQSEAEIQEQRRAVAHLGRVAIAGELSIALAHELRQPLAAILANARAGQRLLAQDPPNLSQMRDILGDIAADDARAADVITRLRALMRNDAVSREPLDVNTVVREALLIAPGHRRAAGVAGDPVRGGPAADCRRPDPVAAGPAESRHQRVRGDGERAGQGTPAGRLDGGSGGRRRRHHGGRRRTGHPAGSARADLRTLRHHEAAGTRPGPGDLPVDRRGARRPAPGVQPRRGRRVVLPLPAVETRPRAA
jgi:PAS domain S-box-containing protein